LLEYLSSNLTYKSFSGISCQLKHKSPCWCKW